MPGPRGSALLVAHRISCSFTISLLTTTRTRDRQPRSHVSRGTSSRPKWTRLSLCVHNCRSTAVWTTCPSSLQEEGRRRVSLAPLAPFLAFLSTAVAQEGHPSISGPNPTLKSQPCQSPHPLLQLSHTHTTGTVTDHQRLVKGLFLHRGLVRCTWVTEMKTGGNGIRGGVRLATAQGLDPGAPHQPPLAPFPGALTSVQDDQGGSELLSQ